MKSVGIFILILASHELCDSVTVPNEGKRVGQHWRNGQNRKPFTQKTIRRESEMATDEADTTNSTSGKDSSDGDSKQLAIPMINFYSSVPNALGFTGQGFLWIRELSAAIGTPLPIFILTIPMLLAGIGLIFIPDLTQLGLPLFYPGGGDADAAFPGIPDLADLPDLNIIQQVGQLLPNGILPPGFLPIPNKRTTK